ncbi:hypothetical protein ACHAPU_002987 [Fusarium lateritium]
MPKSGKRGKSAKETTARQKPPSWYCRLVVLGIKTDEDPEFSDFDEDISELNERELADEDASSFELIDDKESEKSYTGSDSHYYYELKEQRTRRKFELRDQKFQAQQKKTKQRDLELEKEDEVKEAYTKLKESSGQGNDPEKLDLVTDRMFKLYCTDFVDHYYDQHFIPTKHIDFYGLNEGQPINNEASPPEDPEEGNDDTPTEMYDHVYLNVNTPCHFKQFIPPETCGRKRHILETGEGFEVKIRFISRDYLTVTLPCALASSPAVEIDPSTKIPKKFKFVGIRRDLSEYHAMKRELIGKRKRSASS